MVEKYWYGEYRFPEDIKNLYWGLPGTGILKILLDQFLQETGSEEAKKLQDNSYADVAIFKWNKNNFSYALQFENGEKFNEWKNYREDFMSWVESVHDIVCVYSDDSENGKPKLYFWHELPIIRGFDHTNIISG